jgi:VIT1/CCC1 family predicted Fe2+/Mn2+ transporter
MGALAPLANIRGEERGFRRLWRALCQLFHEVMGAIFAILAFAWLNSALRAWTHDVSRWLVALAICMVAIFIFFAITSFLRARKL